MSEELKPCPFCDNAPTLCVCDGSGTVWTKDLETEVLWGHKMTHCMIVCQKCGIKTKPYLTRKGLRKMWNRRADK